jgi:hypothetical protein
MSEEINHDRRRLVGAAVLTLAAAGFATIASDGRTIGQSKADQTGDEHLIRLT